MRIFLELLFHVVDTDTDTDWKISPNYYTSVLVLLCIWCSDYHHNTDAGFDAELFNLVTQIQIQFLIQ